MADTSSTAGPGEKPSNSEYYAWSSKMDDTRKELERLGVQSGPQKIEPAVSAPPQASPAGSAWNAAGTWYVKLAYGGDVAVIELAAVGTGAWLLTVATPPSCTLQHPC